MFKVYYVKGCLHISALAYYCTVQSVLHTSYLIRLDGCGWMVDSFTIGINNALLQFRWCLPMWKANNTVEFCSQCLWQTFFFFLVITFYIIRRKIASKYLFRTEITFSSQKCSSIAIPSPFIPQPFNQKYFLEGTIDYCYLPLSLFLSLSRLFGFVLLLFL